MQNRWYGDVSDIVKWGTTIHLAGDDPRAKILYVVMMRPDDKMDPSLGETGMTITCAPPERVLTHFGRFRRVQDIVHLDKRIKIYDKAFPGTDQDGCEQTRENYFRDVCRWMKGFQGERRIVLVDPDTGTKAKGCTLKHVKPPELEVLYTELRTGDSLVLYQHAHHQGDWIGAMLALFPKGSRVRVFQCPGLTSAVALFAVSKR